MKRHVTLSGALAMATVGCLATGLTAQDTQDRRDASNGCDACHAEVEFLRSHTHSAAEASELLVSSSWLLASAHAENTCTDCHSGVTRYPHADPPLTETCASCHEEADDAWHSGIHSRDMAGDSVAADCASCHSTHQVAWAEELREGPHAVAMNSRCVDCHQGSGLPVGDPHLDTVSCASCHAPHETRDTDDPAAWTAPSLQSRTCGECHDEEAPLAALDVHGRAVGERGSISLAAAELMGASSPPYCTACHAGGHGMLGGSDPEAVHRRQEACITCHADQAESYFGTYHGKATVLGSEIVASCADCHSAHQVEPDSVSVSSVHADQLVATCGECHEASRAAFVLYDSHPDPLDRSRNAPLFYSFVFMNALLLGVLAVFGLHTLLWWVRIILDGRREGSHA